MPAVQSDSTTHKILVGADGKVICCGGGCDCTMQSVTLTAEITFTSHDEPDPCQPSGTPPPPICTCFGNSYDIFLTKTFTRLATTDPSVDTGSNDFLIDAGCKLKGPFNNLGNTAGAFFALTDDVQGQCGCTNVNDPSPDPSFMDATFFLESYISGFEFAVDHFNTSCVCDDGDPTTIDDCGGGATIAGSNFGIAPPFNCNAGYFSSLSFSGTDFTATVTVTVG